ncbi:hypothetical protein DOY81_011406, partial [Sarcophaga bullata]
AAARHQCPYLVKMYEKEFLNQGGNPEWLNGLDYIPPKLRAIYDINKILAHRPWLLRKEHIEKLTRGKNSWSLRSCACHGTLSHFHSLSSFVFSCGLTQKLDGLSSPKLKTPPAALSTPQTPTMETTGVPYHVVVTGVSLVGFAQQHQLPPQSINAATQQQQTQTQHKRLSSTTHQVYCNNNATPSTASGGAVAAGVTSSSSSSTAGGVTTANAAGAAVASTNPTVNGVNRLNAQPSVTVEALMERMKVLSQKRDECNPNFTYQDFARRGAENIPNTFRIQDYSWDDHGYSLVNGYVLKTWIHRNFVVPFGIIFNCIYGIRHDDYDYGEVNQLLDRPLKMFIKTACCFPERITTKDYDSILVELQDSEKVHVNLMVMEARNQAELLYALREIMRYRT